MKIAVSAQGETLESVVDPRFGRAPHFVIVDAESGAFEAVNNAQNVNAMQGAGIQAAETIANSGAEVILTGHCGPNAFRTLNAADIKVCVGAEGTVAQAVEAFKSGALKPADDADVDGHWV